VRPAGRLLRASGARPTACAGGKPWRLSASIVVLAPYRSVPDCEFTDSKTRDAVFDYRVCCVKRAARSTFMPDTMVFPGGAVEAEDVVTSAELFGSRRDDLQSTLRCAAVREAFEESGIGLFEPQLELSPETYAAWRDSVHKDAAQFRTLCEEHTVAPALGSLSFWCSFVTPDTEHDRLSKGGFDARFFVCCATEAQLRMAASDSKETVSLVWLTPSEALAAVENGRISMVPPQWYILRELADACPRMSGVHAYAASPERALQRDHPIKPYPAALEDRERAELLQRHAGDHGVQADAKTGTPPAAFALCYPGDEAHPIFPGPNGARHRMLMVGAFGGRMRFELQRDSAASWKLPLVETSSDWYSLAKL